MPAGVDVFADKPVVGLSSHTFDHSTKQNEAIVAVLEATSRFEAGSTGTVELDIVLQRP